MAKKYNKAKKKEEEKAVLDSKDTTTNSGSEEEVKQEYNQESGLGDSSHTENFQNKKGVSQMAEKALVPDFNKDDYMIEKEVETKEGYIVKARDYKKQFRKKGSIARGQFRTAEAYNVPIDHLKEVADKLNYRKVDNIYINDLIGRHGFYDGKVMSRADLATKLKLPTSAVEIAARKLKEIIKHEDFVGAYKEYLSILKAEADKAEEDELAGGSL